MFPRITPDPADQAREDELRQIVEQASKGDTTVLPQLRQLLDEKPELWRQFGDLTKHAEEALIGLAAGESLVLRESVARKVAELKADLAPNTPLERLLVERIAACWLAANHADTVFGQSRDIKEPREGQLRRRQDSANRRFLESLKLLATVRRLLGSGRGSKKQDNCSAREAEAPVDPFLAAGGLPG